MKKAVLLVLLLWILFLVSLTARERGYGQNITPPQSPDRFAKVRAMILEALQKSGAPSISIAVAENGKVVWEESFGYADKEKKIQATPDSIYALASISKSFTGTGLTVLAERKLVGEWQGTVQTYQGHVPMTLSVRGGQEITIKIDGRTGATIPVNTPLGPLGFRNGWLSGLFFGSIPTEDAKRSRHVVFLRLQLRGDTLSGTVSAVAVNQSFALPYWASLKRKLQP